MAFNVAEGSCLVALSTTIPSTFGLVLEERIVCRNSAVTAVVFQLMVIIDIKGVESTTIFFLDILLLDQRRWCIGYYPEIRCKTTPGSIIDVYIDPFFYGHILIASFLYLPETRDPGRGHKTGRIVVRRQCGSRIQGKRTIAYQGHIAQ